MTTAEIAMTPARRFFNLTRTLAVADFKLRYFDNVLGYFWTLAKPLAMFGILYVVFSVGLRLGAGTEHYTAYLITAIVLFSYFEETTGTAVTSLVAQQNLIRKMPMPLMSIPLSISLGAIFNLALNMIAVLFFVFIDGVTPTWHWIAMVPIIAILIAFSTAVGGIVAALYVPFRDLGAMWDVFLRILFWATPIVYPLSRLGSDTLQHLALMNPLAVIMTQVHHSFIDPSAPSALQAIGNPLLLLVPGTIVVGALALAPYVNRRVLPRLAERL